MTGEDAWISWVAFVGGGCLALIGLLKIIASSVRVVAWMLLLVAGLTGMGYGIRQQPSILDTIALPTQVAQPIRDFLLPKK